MAKKKQTVLIVDDDFVVTEKFKLYLEAAGYVVKTATDGRDALAVLDKQVVDMVLLDVIMPNMDGWQTIKALKHDKRFKEIPVIFITALSDPEEVVHGFDLGGSDYVQKTCSAKELTVRVRHHLDLVQSRLALVQANAALKAEVDQRAKVEEQLLLAFSEMEKLAKSDPLTKLHNRRNAMDLLKAEDSRFKRTGKPYTLLMGDIDKFKSFNDEYGHECGDQVLVAVAKILRKNVRGHDHVVRWGGEEFLVILPECVKGTGFDIAEKIRKLLAKTPIEYNGLSLKITMTFGVADSQDFPEFEACLRKADEALYEGKRSGRNKSVVMES